MRKMAVATLGDVSWGRQVALFYETKEDLLEISRRPAHRDPSEPDLVLHRRQPGST